MRRSRDAVGIADIYRPFKKQYISQFITFDNDIDLLFGINSKLDYILF